ncbi:hypothetical protein LCGC14_0070350 [marine sediment metagenome]|uniref:Uncharacterized protein n=1 Tax=marine sediment metagenome TaxID=412755 RepID=A0A0F9W1E0_9ZZZZ
MVGGSSVLEPTSKVVFFFNVELRESVIRKKQLHFILISLLR